MNLPLNKSFAQKISEHSTSEARADALLLFMNAHGNSFYDESVTQLEHAIQTAVLAREAQAPIHQVVAALLHDIGHFMTDEHDENRDFQAEDWYHEDVGAEGLKPFFDARVIEPVRLHVPAKRYLCSVDAAYYADLSPASKRSFGLQGGPLSPAEISTFENHPHFDAAIQLRRWDDRAKVVGLNTPELSDFRREVAACVLVT